MKKLYKRDPIKQPYKREDSQRTISSLESIAPPSFSVSEDFTEGYPSLSPIGIESFIFGSGSLITKQLADFTNIFPYLPTTPGHPNFGGSFYTILQNDTNVELEGVKGIIPNAGGDVIGGTEPDYVDLIEDGKTIQDEEILQLTVDGETFNIGTYEIV